mgnify:CR=1 FL=1
MAVDDEKIKALLHETKVAAKTILENVETGRSILIVSHLDADGLSAAGILGTALKRIEADFRIRIARWFDEDVADQIAAAKDCLTVLTDMGSGYLDALSRKMEAQPLVILDHHQPLGEADEGFVHVNPHLFGIDSAKDLSGAGTAYLTARELSERNVDLACVAIVGALGDLQDKHEDHKLGGVNTIIVDDAVEAGYLQTETDLLFFGRETRPIHKSLAYSMTMFIPGITGEEDKSLALLLELGIKPKKNDKWRALRDMSQEEKQKLFSALSDYLVSKGYKSDTALSLLGTVYILTHEEPWTPLRDAREFALLLNAAGRTGKPSLGVAICMGDRGRGLDEANKALEEYRQTITGYLRWLEANPDRIEEMESIYVLHGGEAIDEKIVSAISTILSTSMPNMQKPIIAYSVIPEENTIKISARAADPLTKKGFNLGEILRVATERHSGSGGGHNVAAGGQIPLDQKDLFLRYMNKLVKDDLQRLENDGSRDHTVL